MSVICEAAFGLRSATQRRWSVVRADYLRVDLVVECGSYSGLDSVYGAVDSVDVLRIDQALRHYLQS